MKTVCVLGSPRAEGNRAFVAKHFCNAAEKLGAEVRTLALNNLQYRGCQGCWACKTKADACILKDDLSEVLEAVREADVLVMASPVYAGEVSSQLNGFIDRTFCYVVPDYLINQKKTRLAPGQAVVLVLTQAHPDEEVFADIFPRYEFFFKNYIGFDESYLTSGLRSA
jgi:multimeric flavodoxin WrbA